MHIYSEVSATEFNEAYFWENVTLDVSKGGFWGKKNLILPNLMERHATSTVD